MKNEDIKRIVEEKYSRIAIQSSKDSCCGGSSCCDGLDYTVFSESYENLKGYNPDADLGLGCGIPTGYAGIKSGNQVLDLGCGAGNDCFVAAELTGPHGFVSGLDFSDAMIQKARQNADKLNKKNVSFVKGEITRMPFKDESFDVVISNCVLNLIPEKKKAFSEIKRVLKKSGHFCISDVVIKGELPQQLQQDAEMYAGCVSGAISYDDYIEIIKQAGFSKIQLHKMKAVEIPAEILSKYLNENEIDSMNKETGIFSITISAENNK